MHWKQRRLVTKQKKRLETKNVNWKLWNVKIETSLKIKSVISKQTNEAGNVNCFQGMFSMKLTGKRYFETIIWNWKQNQLIILYVSNFKRSFRNSEFCFQIYFSVSKICFLFRISIECFQSALNVYNRFWYFQST